LSKIKNKFESYLHNNDQLKSQSIENLTNSCACACHFKITFYDMHILSELWL